MGLGTALVNVMDAGIDIDVDQKKLSGVDRRECGGFHVVLVLSRPVSPGRVFFMVIICPWIRGSKIKGHAKGSSAC